ncbi:MAG: bifunctional nuclease family protein [Actinobacteria bacterium]|nr:bifunctional nuclease family protein [Actinomycetota bacterium]MCB8995880.1 bifunctional nuclease family protein [Actinomycetota bacterium]MCB9415160.1 bifunctional nuclease family protein [Actinomycetota bacterium]MCB9424597.1 bifunctional nuclease family protein [Actinomycetota bacterium]HRY08487.1 bifunctional nuclease family protein [Candidatus Nanopelagicales bacterium]
MRAVDVVGVRVEMPSNQPIVLLRDTESDRFLPIWIGAVEATAIAFAQQGVQPERPLTHDLLRDVIGALGRRLERVDIVDLRDGIFFAELVFDNGVTVSARPSDAIALALRTGSPLFAAEHVLDDAAIEMPAEEEEEEGEEAEVEAFREFLDHVTPEDFEGGSAQ